MTEIELKLFDITGRDIQKINFESEEDFKHLPGNRQREDLIVEYYKSQDYIAVRNTRNLSALEDKLSYRDLFAMRNYFSKPLEKIFCKGVPDVFAFRYKEGADPNRPISTDIDEIIFIEEKSRNGGLGLQQLEWFCQNPEKEMYVGRLRTV